MSDKEKEYRDALLRIVESDDNKERAWQSGQHTSITRWIPTEEAIQSARELLNNE